MCQETVMMMLIVENEIYNQEEIEDGNSMSV